MCKDLKLNKLGSYLAGILEGDGTIYVPENYRNKKNFINYPYISICFNIVDKPLAEKFIEKFEGKLYINKLNTFVIWKIYKIEKIIEIIYLIGPFFRTHKLKKLNDLIIYLNKNFKFYLNNKEIPLYELDTSKLDSNAWLSGFSDVDANFNVTISQRKHKKAKRVSISFRIEIKKDEGYFFLCTELAYLLGVSLYVRKRVVGLNIYYSYLIIAFSKKSHEIVCNYFEKFPLFSSKYLNFLDWKEIYLLQRSKGNNILSNIDLQYCIFIKNRLKNKRKIYDWKHLLFFYEK